jgi:hypothetical protein
MSMTRGEKTSNVRRCVSFPDILNADTENGARCATNGALLKATVLKADMMYLGY